MHANVNPNQPAFTKKQRPGWGRKCAATLALGLGLFSLAANSTTCPGGRAPPCPPQRPAKADPHPHQLYTSSYQGPKNTAYTTAKKPTTFTAAKKQSIGPVSPGPTHLGSASSSTTHKNAIIFVGGHSSPTGSSKVALNPQPIPPGHAVLDSHAQTTVIKPPQPDPYAH